MIKVETNIPIPSGKGWRAKYPWRDLEVNQSFLVTDVSFRTMQSGASASGKRLNRKFIARVVDGGVRCWRIA